MNLGKSTVKLRYAIEGSTIHKVEVHSESTVSCDGRSLKYDLKRVDEYCYSLILDGLSYEILLLDASGGQYIMQIGTYICPVRIDRFDPVLRGKGCREEGRGAQVLAIKAPMPGMVARIQVKAGDHITSGSAILVLEAMKMENEIRSPYTGLVKMVHAKERTQVERNDILVSLEVI